MCGIIGYIGKEHPKEILLEGLKNLEYRGYDSSGMAFKKGKEIQIVKCVGKIAFLEEKLQKEKLLDGQLMVNQVKRMPTRIKLVKLH